MARRGGAPAGAGGPPKAVAGADGGDPGARRGPGRPGAGPRRNRLARRPGAAAPPPSAATRRGRPPSAGTTGAARRPPPPRPLHGRAEPQRYGHELADRAPAGVDAVRPGLAVRRGREGVPMTGDGVRIDRNTPTVCPRGCGRAVGVLLTVHLREAMWPSSAASEPAAAPDRPGGLLTEGARRTPRGSATAPPGPRGGRAARRAGAAWPAARARPGPAPPAGGGCGARCSARR